MKGILHINLKLSGTTSVGSGSEVAFERTLGVSLSVGGNAPDDFSEVLLDAIKNELGSVVQESVEASADRYRG